MKTLKTWDWLSAKVLSLDQRHLKCYYKKMRIFLINYWMWDSQYTLLRSRADRRTRVWCSELEAKFALQGTLEGEFLKFIRGSFLY